MLLPFPHVHVHVADHAGCGGVATVMGWPGSRRRVLMWVLGVGLSPWQFLGGGVLCRAACASCRCYVAAYDGAAARARRPHARVKASACLGGVCAADGDICGRRGQAHAARPGAALHHAQRGGEEPQAERPAGCAGLQPGLRRCTCSNACILTCASYVRGVAHTLL